MSGLVERLRAAGCVYAEDEAALLLEAAVGSELDALVERRVAGEPLEHVLGWAEFAGLRLSVGPGVFVPRARSAVLVTTTMNRLEVLTSPVVVELCCGVAPVASAVRARRPDAELHVADLDDRALVHARRNLGPGAGVWCGDVFDALPDALRGRIDVLVANAPYVPSGQIAFMPPEARDHEPRHTLDGGDGGVELHRRIAGECLDWLGPEGFVVVETSQQQALMTRQLFVEVGLRVTMIEQPDVDGTAVLGRRPR